MCSSILDFFKTNINKIKESIAFRLEGRPRDPLSIDVSNVRTVLSDLKPVNVEEVKRLVSSMPAKSSPMDVFPTSLLKLCVDIFIYRLTPAAVFRGGMFFIEVQNCVSHSTSKTNRTHSWQFRKLSTNFEFKYNLKDTRWIGLILVRIQPHVYSSANFSIFQSAYRRYNSTESTLAKILDDLNEAAGSHNH